MKKFSFLIYHNDYDVFLQDLRKLGLIHVAQQTKTAEYNDELENYLSQLKKLQEAKKILQKLITDDKEEMPQNPADMALGYKIPEKIEAVQEVYQLELTEQMQSAINICTVNFWNYWGQKLVNVLRPLHSLKSKEFENIDNEDLLNRGELWD